MNVSCPLLSVTNSQADGFGIGWYDPVLNELPIPTTTRRDTLGTAPPSPSPAPGPGPSTLRTGTPAASPAAGVVPLAAEEEAHEEEEARARQAAQVREAEREIEIERPCVFKSISPAWSNANLTRLAEKIRSPLIFAHVRASTMAGARKWRIS